MSAALRIRHTLTAHHLRDRFARKSSRIAICACGWRCAMFRKIDRRSRLRRLFVCLPTGGHRWGDAEEASTGPAGGPDEEFVSLGYWKQCQKCYRCVDVPGAK